METECTCDRCETEVTTLYLVTPFDDVEALCALCVDEIEDAAKAERAQFETMRRGQL